MVAIVTEASAHRVCLEAVRSGGKVTMGQYDVGTLRPGILFTYLRVHAQRISLVDFLTCSAFVLKI